MKFNSNKLIKLSACIILCELAGVIGSVFTTSSIAKWYATLEKPNFNPPSWIFAPVWSLLFLLMGIAFYIVWQEKWQIKNHIKIAVFEKIKINPKLIFFVQLFLNVYWSFLFFGKHSIGGAFFELLVLWLAILLTTVAFYKISKVAAYLLYPYLIWVAFAGVLNFSLWILN